MDQRTAIEIMSGRRRGVGPAVLRAAGWVVSKGYGAAAWLRRRLYRAGVFGSHRAPVPVISVGNLTTGGTGKTPMVIWLVGWLKEAGMTPAILTRGYKAVEGKSDEAEMLWQATGAPVVVDPDRVGAARAAADGGADVLVLDDGFQHRRLKRDLDIVLIDATCPLGFGHCLPRGLLREPLSALRDADAVVITRADSIGAEELASLSRRLSAAAPDASLHTSGHAPTAVVIQAGRHLPPSALAGRRVVAFCGIGNPDSFFNMLAGAGADLAERIAFDDHVAYGPAELGRVNQALKDTGAEAAVTTAKDRVKIAPADLSAPLWTVRIEVRIRDGQDQLLEKVRQAIGRG